MSQIADRQKTVEKQQITQDPSKSIALALSGCTGRAVAYIGLLEVLVENNIPIRGLSACSSASLVAAAFASGRLKELKEKVFKLDARELFELFEPSFKGGLFSLDRINTEFGDLLTVENLEDLQVPLAIVASDLQSGKDVVFSMGNIMRAVRASCSMPGIFEPEIWGDKILVDVGLFNVVPIEAAQIFGAGPVVGVRIKNNKATPSYSNLFNLKRRYNYVKSPFVRMNAYARERFGRASQELAPDVTIEGPQVPSFISIFAKSLDHAIEKMKAPENFVCDYMIAIEAGHYGRVSIKNFVNMYEDGRKAGLEALPKLRELLA